MRSSTTSSGKERPSNFNVSIAEELISKMRRNCEVEPESEGLPESSTSKCCTNSVWSWLSVMANTAPESSTTQRTCDSEEDG